MSKRSNRRSKSKRALALLSLRAELSLMIDEPKALPLVNSLMAGELRHAIKYITENGRLPHYLLIFNPLQSELQRAADRMQRDIDRQMLALPPLNLTSSGYPATILPMS